eukprot:57155-Pleurochrysis_carterae.AAC.2
MDVASAICAAEESTEKLKRAAAVQERQLRYERSTRMRLAAESQKATEENKRLQEENASLKKQQTQQQKRDGKGLEGRVASLNSALEAQKQQYVESAARAAEAESNASGAAKEAAAAKARAEQVEQRTALKRRSTRRQRRWRPLKSRRARPPRRRHAQRLSWTRPERPTSLLLSRTGSTSLPCLQRQHG